MSNLKKKRVQVKKSDALRALVTEFLPADTPIIFSGDGFYLRAVKHSSTSAGLAEDLFRKLVVQKGEDVWCEPYSYKIKKNHLSYRSLSVIHPVSQWRCAEFYELNHSAIVHYTTRSKFTLRAPNAVASSHYIKSDISDLTRFKRSQVAISGLDQQVASCPSYFSYDGFGRLYQFFDSRIFIDLEAKYSHLWMIDVSKCFDSIYTHTILWAIKDKRFAKESFSFKSFGAAFDKLMQSANYGETSGIVIGPEISRIFAEILMQEIDNEVETRLRDRGVFHLRDYEIKRYVDDFFIFSVSSDIAKEIYSEIEFVLSEFKLGINEAKLQKIDRPFLTRKSKTIIDASSILSAYTSKFMDLSPSESDGVSGKFLLPTRIYKPDRLFISFCNDVKACCMNNLGGYDEVSGYLISSLKNRAMRLMLVSTDGVESGWHGRMYDALILIVRSIFFLYSVAPSVTASYRMATCLIAILRYSKISLTDYHESIKVSIFSQVISIVDVSRSSSGVDGFVDLETINLLLAVSEFDDDFLVPPRVLERVFGDSKRASYFSLVSAMFYIKNRDGYSSLRKRIYEFVDGIVFGKDKIVGSAEKALTALDFVACPYIDFSRREQWAKAILDELGIASSNPTDVASLVKDFESMPWFVDWHEIDLLNLLERKELRMVY